MIIEKFIGYPVLVQLKNPILAAVSASEAELDDGEKCGSAMIAFYQDPENPRAQQPMVLQALRGSIEDVDSEYVIVATLGGDNLTPVRCCIERANVANVTFCVEHREMPREEPKRIIS